MNTYAKYGLAGFIGWLLGLSGTPNPLTLLSLASFLFKQGQNAVEWAEMVIPQHVCPGADPETITVAVEQRLKERGITYGEWIEQPEDSTDLVLEVNAKQLDWATHTITTTDMPSYVEQMPSSSDGLFESVRGVFEG